MKQLGRWSDDDGRSAADLLAFEQDGTTGALLFQDFWLYDELVVALQADTLGVSRTGRLEELCWVAGFTALKGLMRRGQIEQMAADKRRPVQYAPASDLGFIRNMTWARDEIAVEVLTLAMPRLMSHLAAGKWDPTRLDRASLPTFVIGGCALQYAAGYETWSKRFHDGDAETFVDNGQPGRRHLHTAADSTERLVETRQAVDQVLALVPARDKELVELLLLGVSAKEAAELLGLTARTVEGRIYQLRKSVLRHVASGEINPPVGVRPSKSTLHRAGAA